MDKIEINGPIAKRGDKTIRVSPAQGALLDCLLGPSRRGEIWRTLDECLFAVYGGQDEPSTAETCVRLFKSQLVKKLRGLDVVIQTGYKYGYYLELK
jgi:hypothetical protein